MSPPEKIEARVGVDKVREEIVDLARSFVFTTLNVPDDEDKTDADWEKDEIARGWRQRAFRDYWGLAGDFLDITKGENQTSRDLHMVCQGFALAMEYVPRFIVWRASSLAIATEAGTAETGDTGSVHEGAGRQASPKSRPTPTTKEN